MLLLVILFVVNDSFIHYYYQHNPVVLTGAMDGTNGRRPWVSFCVNMVPGIVAFIAVIGVRGAFSSGKGAIVV